MKNIQKHTLISLCTIQPVSFFKKLEKEGEIWGDEEEIVNNLNQFYDEKSHSFIEIEECFKEKKIQNSDLSKFDIFNFDFQQPIISNYFEENKGFLPSYYWLRSQMYKRIQNNEFKTEIFDRNAMPIFSWFKYGKRNFPHIKTCQTYFPDKKDGLRIYFQLPIEEVFLTDFEYWHCVLNNGGVLEEDNLSDEEFEKQYEKLERDSVLKEKSWHKIFYDNEKAIQERKQLNKFIQATCFRIKLENVVKVQNLF